MISWVICFWLIDWFVFDWLKDWFWLGEGLILIEELTFFFFPDGLSFGPGFFFFPDRLSCGFEFFFFQIVQNVDAERSGKKKKISSIKINPEVVRCVPRSILIDWSKKNFFTTESSVLDLGRSRIQLNPEPAQGHMFEDSGRSMIQLNLEPARGHTFEGSGRSPLIVWRKTIESSVCCIGIT